MNFRISIGRGATASGTGLRQIYSLPNFSFESSQEPHVFQVSGGGQGFLIGTVYGIRDGKNGIAPAGPAYDAIARLVQSAPVEKVVQALEGRFLIVRLQANGTGEIFTDRFATVDLYYKKSGDMITIASDLSFLGQAGPYSQAALAYGLSVYGFRPPKTHTFFSEVRRCAVGQYCAFNEDRFEFKQIPFSPVRAQEYGDRELNEYADFFLDAVRVRGSEDGNVVFLSSGWDSTSILAALVHVFGKKRVRAVTGRTLYADRTGVNNPFEIERAQKMADYFGIRLDIVDFNYAKAVPAVFEEIRGLIRSHNMAGITYLNHAQLFDFVRKTTGGNEVVFAGEISDAAHSFGFSQYASIFHPILEFREYSDKMGSYLFGPSFLKSLYAGKGVDDLIYRTFRTPLEGARFDEAVTEPMEVHRQLLRGVFFNGARIPFYSLKNINFLTDTGVGALQGLMNEYLDGPARQITPETLYSWYLHLYNSFHWQGATVLPIHVLGSAMGLNTALPFWDSRLQEFLSAMPENFGRGLDLNPPKYPLKWMLKHRIDYPMHLQTGPHSYLYDVDPDFNHNAELLYGSALNPYLKSIFAKKRYRNVLTGDVFKVDYLDKIVDDFLAGTERRGGELNDLFALATAEMVGWFGE